MRVEINKDKKVNRTLINIYSIFVTSVEIVTAISITIIIYSIVAKLIFNKQYLDYINILDLLKVYNTDFWQTILLNIREVGGYFLILLSLQLVVLFAWSYIYRNLEVLDVDRHFSVQKILLRAHKSLVYFVITAYFMLNIFQNYSDETRAIISDYNNLSKIVLMVLIASMTVRTIRTCNMLVKNQFVYKYKQEIKHKDSTDEKNDYLDYVKREYRNRTITLVSSIGMFLLANYILTVV